LQPAPLLNFFVRVRHLTFVQIALKELHYDNGVRVEQPALPRSEKVSGTDFTLFAPTKGKRDIHECRLSPLFPPGARQGLGLPRRGDGYAHAKHMRDAVLPAMSAVRTLGDKLETMVADDLWPLPTYREMLFLK